ncbi:hypothetical protein B0H14DRAFT_3509328 [Mycena olivaceomarginata]|nr:hypothetical protein B0H14DRAFT_3509328 [Mycena olivaceomarginata]
MAPPAAHPRRRPPRLPPRPFISRETLPTSIAESLPVTLHPPPPPVMRGRHVYRGGRGIRDFPKVSTSLGGGDLEELVLAALKNCVNLRTCTWTRDGALNSAVLRVLQASDTLAELEINGHSDGHYDASVLEGFVHLRRMSLIMPSADVLPSLTLICKTSPLITDNVLEALAPNLVHLEQFSLTDCLRVTHRGISAILSHNAAGLRALALEGLAPKFTSPRSPHTAPPPPPSSRACTASPSACTPPSGSHMVSLSSRTRPCSRSSSCTIQLYAPDPLFLHPTAAADWRALVDAHGPRLTRVGASDGDQPARGGGLLLAPSSRISALAGWDSPMTQDALAACPRAPTSSLPCTSTSPRPPLSSPESSTSPSDREFGVYMQIDVEVPVILKAPDALAIVRRYPPMIALFRCNARVWQVERKVRRTDTGELSLGYYESPDVPEQFLVVRT